MEFRCWHFSMINVVLNHCKSVLENFHSGKMSPQCFFFSFGKIECCNFSLLDVTCDANGGYENLKFTTVALVLGLCKPSLIYRRLTCFLHPCTDLHGDMGDWHIHQSRIHSDLQGIQVHSHRSKPQEHPDT